MALYPPTQNWKQSKKGKMMSDMKCPFCGKQMYHPVGKATWSCQNWDCLKSEGMIGNHVLWQELIRTRKALDVAIDTLKEYADRDNWGMGFAPWLEDGFKDALYTEDGYKTAEKALAEITALEQKD